MKKGTKPAVAGYNDNDWKAESDMRTLMEAEAIRRDAKRLAAAKACASKRLEDMASVMAEKTP